ncbi:MAG TPA: hypothetical protein VFF59_05575, partial [Anaerolineae bacterium]|nr:hypothetical protein [Anaerolineae bacterium]
MTDLSITLAGVCVAYDFRALLLTGNGALEVAQRSKWAIVAQGQVTLSLGVALFDRPFIFTPTRIITERNQTIDGERVFPWLAEQGYAMPRSEVFGLNVRGRESQIFARDIDLEASPIAVCDYGNWVIGLVTIDPAAPDTCPTDP